VTRDLELEAILGHKLTGFTCDDGKDTDYLIDQEVVSRWNWKCGLCGESLPAGKTHLFWVSRHNGRLHILRRHDDFMC
jgi:hypothetical protein